MIRSHSPLSPPPPLISSPRPSLPLLPPPLLLLILLFPLPLHSAPPTQLPLPSPAPSLTPSPSHHPLPSSIPSPPPRSSLSPPSRPPSSLTLPSPSPPTTSSPNLTPTPNPTRTPSPATRSSPVFLPPTTTPLVTHFGYFHLTGQQLIQLGQALLSLSSLGYSSDARYLDLLALFHAALRFHHERTAAKARQFNAIKQLEKDMRRQCGLFSAAQYQQLLVQCKALQFAVSGQPLPESLLAVLKGFGYDKERGQQPGHWMLNHKQAHAVRDIVSKMADPCTVLVDVLSAKQVFPILPAAMLAEERHKLISAQMKERLRELNEALERKDLSVAASLQSARRREARVAVLLEKKQLELVELQRRVRLQVLASMPAEKMASGYRSRKEIELEHRKRERAKKSLRAREDKETRKARKVFLSAVLSHSRDFSTWHREKRRLMKRAGDGVVKEMEEMERKRAMENKMAEKERLAALRENNEEEYIRLLKKAKNERLLTLIRQTDQYMQTIGAHIKEEQRKAQGGIGSASSSSSSSSASSVSQEAASDATADTSLDDYLYSRQRYYGMAHAVQEEVTQPKSLIAGQLRSYQLHGLQWLVSLWNNNLNGILADEMGLGKTVQTCSLIAHLMEVKHNYGPFLIIVPMSTLHNNWEYEFDRWFPSCQKVIYDGNKEQRRAVKDKYIVTRNFNVLMTTFEFAMRDKAVLRQVPWEMIVIDEAHRLKNPKCKLALELATYPTQSRRVALTGTPLQNELPELWSLLNFLHPTIFNSCENFEKWFATPFASMTVGAKEERAAAFAMSEEEKLLVINRLHAILRPFMLRREKREVEKDLADKIEKVLRCELTPTQRLLYSSIMDGKVSIHNRMVQLRKVCNHPFLFHPYVRNVPGATQYSMDEELVSMCGKFTLLDSILPKLKATGHRVLIFNQMTRTMNILEDYFRMRDYSFLRLDGNTNTGDRSDSLKAYNAVDSSYFIFILSTKAGGLGLNLQSADTVILFDSDWNPQNDLQAQARAHRIGQKQQVVVLRLITSSTIEEKVLATAHQKLKDEAMVIQAGMFHDHYSHTTSRTMVERAMREQLEGEDDVADEDEVCKALARSEEELRIFQQMDAQKKEMRLAKEVAEAKERKRRGQGEVDPLTVPRWVYEWCLHGNRAHSTDQTPVPFSKKQVMADRIAMMDPLSDEAKLAWEEYAELEREEGRERDALRAKEEELRRLAEGKGKGGTKRKANALQDAQEMDELIEEETELTQGAIEEAAEAIAAGSDFLAALSEEEEEGDRSEEEEKEQGADGDGQRTPRPPVGVKRKRTAAGAAAARKRRKAPRMGGGRRKKKPPPRRPTTNGTNGAVAPLPNPPPPPVMIGPSTASSRSSSPLSVHSRSPSPSVLSIARRPKTLVIKLKREDGNTVVDKLTHHQAGQWDGEDEEEQGEESEEQQPQPQPQGREADGGGEKEEVDEMEVDIMQ